MGYSDIGKVGKIIFFSNSVKDLRDSPAGMADVDLTEKFLAEIAGWDVMKQARHLLANDRVLSGNWSPPVLKGVVQTEGGSLRAGLVIKSKVDVENMCPCRQSREWGTMCVHSVGVGLRVLQRDAQDSVRESTKVSSEPGRKSKQAPVSHFERTVASDESAASLKLWVVFPPNWRSGISQGKVTVFFEGETSAGRRPLNAVPRGNSVGVSEQDHRLLNQIELLTGGDLPAMWPFDLPALTELFGVLVEHPRVVLGRKDKIDVSRSPWVPKLSVMLQEDGRLQLTTSESIDGMEWIPGKELYVVSGNQIQRMGLPARCAPVLQGEMLLERAYVPEFLQACGAFLTGESQCQTNFALDDFEFVPSAPVFVLSLEGGLAVLRARLECRYGSRVFTVGVTNKNEAVWVPDPESKYRYTTRDLRAESDALNRLLRYQFRGPDNGGYFEVKGQDAVLDFFAREYPHLCQTWEVSLDERLERSTQKNLERVQPTLEFQSSGIEWLDFRVDYASDGGTRFRESEIQQWLLSGRAHRKLSNGKIAMLDMEAVEEFKEVLRDCSPQQTDGGYRMDAQQAGFLDASVQELGWRVGGDVQWRERVGAVSDAQMELPDIGHLDSVLRDYQKRGVAWLEFLRQADFGGVLADEMGLGKTVQVLALLESLRLRRKNSSSPLKALVVCPSSLVFNWASEASRFTPEMKVLSLHGGQRKRRFAEINDHDLIITSYALIRRDLDHYQQHEFSVLILDEAQHIKNRQTQNAKAVKAVKAANRLVLTGTPMENSVLDLWSIFDFLMPGYLGSANDFRERYEAPIVKERSEEVMQRLGRRLRPFVLRRTKRDVAPELPERLEQTVSCPLTSEQREVYQQIMNVSRSEVLAAAEDGTGRERMMILNALMRLRQVCCDLRLLKLPKAPREASGKLAMFNELLEQVLDGNHRVLVFSQFVSMLQLIREQLDSSEIEYCYLDGSTTNRGAVVERFQSSSIPVFLISLKAGGVGLNLTGADTVIHFDPWWNPAIEDQATGRAHRIGQTRVVTSYKLITEDTVEQKILQLQERKREVIEGTLGDENRFVESLTIDDFRGLFAD